MPNFGLSHFVREARRRRVFRVAGLYIVTAWVALQVADLLFESWGISSAALRHVWVGALLGLPVALALGWRYDITGGKIVRVASTDADADLSIGRADIVILAAVVAVVAAIAYDTALDVAATPDAGPTDAPVPEVVANSVAVLPFVNMSGNPDNEYFSDGLSETLLHMLAQVPELKVSARTSSFAFKGKDQDIRAIAAALGVAHVLEGSVQRAGGQVRITAQLIRAEDGFHVWSENYDRTLEDIFGIQDEIAQRVSANLTRSLLGRGAEVEIHGIGTANVEAYDLYLRAVAEQNHASYESIKSAEGLLKEAIAADPDFHSAKTQLASNYFLQVEAGLRRPRAAIEEMIALLEQVLAAEPDNARAQAWMLISQAGSASFAGREVDREEVIDRLRALVAEAPSEVEPKQLLLQPLAAMGKTEEAIALMQDILELDPLNGGVLREIGQAHMSMGDWSNAREMLRRSLEVDPEQPYTFQMLGDVDRAVGDATGFVRNYMMSIKLDSQDYGYAARLANFLYYLGLQQEGNYFRDRSNAIAPTSSHARRMELVREVRFGTPENSLALARQMLEDHVDMHSSAWDEAAFELFAISDLLGTPSDALTFAEQMSPGFSDYAQPVSPELVVLRLFALGAFSQVESPEELLQRLGDFDYFLNELLINGGPPEWRMQEFALRGDAQAAIDVALEEIFTRPAISKVTVDRIFELSFMADVAADPRIQESLKLWREERDRAAEEVRDYLAGINAQ